MKQFSILFLFFAQSIFADVLINLPKDIPTEVERYENIRISWGEIVSSHGGSLFINSGDEVEELAKQRTALKFLFKDLEGYINDVCITFSEEGHLVTYINSNELHCKEKDLAFTLLKLQHSSDLKNFYEAYDKAVQKRLDSLISVIEQAQELNSSTDRLLVYQFRIEYAVLMSLQELYNDFGTRVILSK